MAKKKVETVEVPVPSWLSSRVRPGEFGVDPDGFYPDILDQFEAHPGVPYEGVVDQYWLECAYQCMKLTVQGFLALTGQDPRPELTLRLIVDGANDHKDRWAQKNHPEGRYAEIRAESTMPDRVVGGEARNHFRTMKGYIPQ